MRWLGARKGISLTQRGATIRHASLVLGGVAPVPYRARLVEDYLRGKTPAEVDPVHAGSLAVPDARPMADNGYKVILAANLVKQAVQQLLSPSNP